MAKLKKIFIASFIFLFLFSFNSYSEIVKKIELKGNQRISLETIVIFADIIIDKDYQSSDINLLIKKLYETTFFSDIGVELKNNVLTITVKENPLINTIVFKNEKAKKYIDTMKEFLTLREKTSFMQNYVKEDAEFDGYEIELGRTIKMANGDESISLSIIHPKYVKINIDAIRP